MTAPARPHRGLRPGFGGSTFARGAAARAVLGVSIALGALGLAWGVEHVPLPANAPGVVPLRDQAPMAPTPAVAARLVAASSHRRVRIESTFPAAWSVAAGDWPLTPSSSDPTHWVGDVPVREVVVTATPVDGTDTSLHGLRIEVSGGVRAEWGNDAVTAVIPAQTATP